MRGPHSALRPRSFSLPHLSLSSLSLNRDPLVHTTHSPPTILHTPRLPAAIPTSPCPSSSSAYLAPRSRYLLPVSLPPLTPQLTRPHKVTTRYVDLQPVGMGESALRSPPIRSPSNTSLLQARLVSSGQSPAPLSPLPVSYPRISRSSAKDQLTGSSVAIKKIMKPFSTSVLSKRTYRELKLLKHIQHENVSPFWLHPLSLLTRVSLQIISLSDVFISPLEDMSVPSSYLHSCLSSHSPSYFVTELLGTDLHRLLTSRPLEKDRKSTRLNSSHSGESRMPSSA